MACNKCATARAAAMSAGACAGGEATVQVSIPFSADKQRFMPPLLSSHSRATIASPPCESMLTEVRKTPHRRALTFALWCANFRTKVRQLSHVGDSILSWL